MVYEVWLGSVPCSSNLSSVRFDARYFEPSPLLGSINLESNRAARDRLPSLITISVITFISEYDSRNCLLLYSDLEKCFDKFLGSISQQVQSIYFLLLMLRIINMYSKSSETS